MKKTTGILAGMLLFCSVAFAQDRPSRLPPTTEESTRYGWATVLRSDPVYAEASDTAAAAQEDCREESAPSPPAHEEPPHVDSRAGGTVVGAIIGGVIGSMFGKGDGHKAATAGGVVAGAMIGNRVAAASDARAEDVHMDVDNGADQSPPPAGHRCPKAQTRGRIVAYDVEYRYAGELYMARLAYDPGDRMRVKISVVPAD